MAQQGKTKQRSSLQHNPQTPAEVSSCMALNTCTLHEACNFTNHRYSFSAHCYLYSAHFLSHQPKKHSILKLVQCHIVHIFYRMNHWQKLFYFFFILEGVLYHASVALTDGSILSTLLHNVALVISSHTEREAHCSPDEQWTGVRWNHTVFDDLPPAQ